MELPDTLHGQLYLLSYDVEQHRFRVDSGADARWRFDRALEAAMLTDLYLTGYIENRDGKAYRRGSERHDDPLLNKALQGVDGQRWARLVGFNVRRPRKRACEQLVASGWLEVQRQAFGVVPARFGVCDESMVGALAERVRAALLSVLNDPSTDPRLVALGLIAAQTDMHVVSDFVDDRRQRETLRQLTLAAIEPILGLHEAILNRLAESRSQGIFAI